MKTKLFILSIIFFIAGCVNTSNYYIDKLQVFYTDGEQTFILEKENIKVKDEIKDVKKKLMTPIEQFLQLLDEDEKEE